MPSALAALGLGKRIGRGQNSVQHLNQRGLAGAVLAKQGVDLALGKLEAHAIIGGEGAEPLGDVANRQQRRRARARP
jgi:hypothetical protein